MLVLKVGMSSPIERRIHAKSCHMVIRYLSLYLVFDLVFQTLSKSLRELAVWKNKKKVGKFARW
jgi:hypothetical protein